MYDLESQLDHVNLVLVGNDVSLEHCLRDGESALIGSSVGCPLRVDDPKVPSQVCLIELVAGTLTLHDWCADGTTRVNGSPIEAEEQTLALADVVEFGEYRIQFHAGQSNFEQPQNAAEVGQRAEEHGGDSPGIDRTTFRESMLPDVSAKEPQRPAAPAPTEVLSVEESTLGLLHTEIANLQQELQDREAVIARFESKSGSLDEPENQDQVVSRQRLDGLLKELEVADHRISNLEHEVRVFEELRAAEAEEKQQIESWVNDIEVRLSQREEEIAAEIEQLRGRLQKEREERVATQQQADRQLAEGQDTPELQESLELLRRDHEVLREKHDEAIERCRTLENECGTLREASTEAAFQERVNEAIRVERLQLSQERAAISRKEHEINTKIRELESQLADTPDRPTEADDRFRVFRERLKELHMEEKKQHAAPSVGQRLVKLWQRLDGPTDRD